MSIVRLNTRRVEKIWGRRTFGPGLMIRLLIRTRLAKSGSRILAAAIERYSSNICLRLKNCRSRFILMMRWRASKAWREVRARLGQSLMPSPSQQSRSGPSKPCPRKSFGAPRSTGALSSLSTGTGHDAAMSFYSPAGTIHVIGAGLTLIEVQQNPENTFRLYDYGRPRELHLEESVAAARPVPYVRPSEARQIAGATLRLMPSSDILLAYAGSDIIGPDCKLAKPTAKSL